METRLQYLAKHLRLADQLEIFRMYGVGPEIALEYAAAQSTSFTIYDDPKGCPGAAVGVQNEGNGSAVIWMLGTLSINKYPIYCMKLARKNLTKFQEQYTRLWNHVDTDNQDAIRWLGVLGFKFGKTENMGVLNHPFVKFEWRKT